MTMASGGNIKKIKLQNQMLVLKLIATCEGISRIELSKKTGLTKMAVSNLVSSLMEAGLVTEEATPPQANPRLGRNPISLCISPTSPCVCGISIKRGSCRIILGDLAGRVLDREALTDFAGMSAKRLLAFLQEGFGRLQARTARPIVAVGIACIGPVNSETGVVLNPPFFHGIQDLPLVQLVEDFTGLPVYLYNDGNAGALAELTYGSGRNVNNFAYLHIMHGIGSGYALEGKVYNGNVGQSGEIGHSTINFGGPQCSCGNHGCLELYANTENVRRHIRDRAALYASSPLAAMQNPSLTDVIDAANRSDGLAISALEEYLSYVAHALTNVINFLDLSYIIVDYRSTCNGTVLEDILYRRMLSSVHHFKTKNILITRAQFGGDAPLIGSIALVAEKIFENEIPLAPLV